ncbi:hypothetical protein EDC04DRAFT_2871409 [Pisolithus marmoratus]|nr:hypothetical protein EDC04DRAFT_2871409 [Pisolithus marmoratus]
MVGELEFIKAIPVVKMPIIAACMMEFVNSTVSGNIQSITGLLSQARIHDPKDKDLGTAEHVQAILQCWAVEDSPWNQCQYVIFIPGLFHLKMAATDALWHAFIHPAAASHDDTSLMHDIGILQPKETGIYQSKPGLDCWWSEVANLNLRFRTLEAFADTMPMFTQVKDIANTITHKYVTTNALKRVHWKPSSQHNMQLENALIINKYMLLYEELMHLCIIAWILIFKATDKHKYAAYMTEFLLNIHLVYPAGLWGAMCYSMLVNLSGQQGKFHGDDWCVELNNLFIKVINSSKFSNHTIPCIILELPLVQVYHNLHGIFQKHFLHNHVMTR